jgi:hypothetical protein
VPLPGLRALGHPAPGAVAIPTALGVIRPAIVRQSDATFSLRCHRFNPGSLRVHVRFVADEVLVCLRLSPANLYFAIAL